MSSTKRDSETQSQSREARQRQNRDAESKDTEAHKVRQQEGEQVSGRIRERTDAKNAGGSAVCETKPKPNMYG